MSRIYSINENVYLYRHQTHEKWYVRKKPMIPIKNEKRHILIEMYSDYSSRPHLPNGKFCWGAHSTMFSRPDLVDRFNFDQSAFLANDYSDIDKRIYSQIVWLDSPEDYYLKLAQASISGRVSKDWISYLSIG